MKKILVWYKRVIEIEGQQMWLQRLSPDFKPEEDLPIAPVWVLLPGLPFHMHTWHYVKQVVSSIGIPLEMDLATRGRTRPSMTKVRIEIDLLKPQPENVYVGQIYEDSPQKGFVQKLEYEGIPKYCKFCKKLSHNMINCRVLERKKIAEAREEEIRKGKDELVGDNVMEVTSNTSHNLTNGKKQNTRDVTNERLGMEKGDNSKEKYKKGTTDHNNDNDDGGQCTEKLGKKKKKRRKKKMPQKKSSVIFKPTIIKKGSRKMSQPFINISVRQDTMETIMEESLNLVAEVHQSDEGARKKLKEVETSIKNIMGANTNEAIQDTESVNKGEQADNEN
ncbi:uncharacterized protein [Nicotiana sylvestris]|uniref:uncharacterized protein n=1 Tax=Nicotiana sylvestris TaxID=4096 RepID=UPI00388C70B8